MINFIFQGGSSPNDLRNLGAKEAKDLYTKLGRFPVQVGIDTLVKSFTNSTALILHSYFIVVGVSRKGTGSLPSNLQRTHDHLRWQCY